jgi:hypothetical protein
VPEKKTLYLGDLFCSRIGICAQPVPIVGLLSISFTLSRRVVLQFRGEGFLRLEVRAVKSYFECDLNYIISMVCIYCEGIASCADRCGTAIAYIMSSVCYYGIFEEKI